jgi:hypothetical protein
MRGILIPVDDTTPAETVTRAVAARMREGGVDGVHLLNVQAPLTGYSSQFVRGESIRDFQRERGEKAMAQTRRRFDAAGLRYTAHLCVGDVASTIGEAARELRVAEILMGLDQEGWLDGLMTWLWVNRIRRYATVPVVVVVAPPAELVPAVGGFKPTYPR